MGAKSIRTGEVAGITKINREEAIFISGLNVTFLDCKSALLKILNHSVFKFGERFSTLGCCCSNNPEIDILRESLYEIIGF